MSLLVVRILLHAHICLCIYLTLLLVYALVADEKLHYALLPSCPARCGYFPA